MTAFRTGRGRETAEDKQRAKKSCTGVMEHEGRQALFLVLFFFLRLIFSKEREEATLVQNREKNLKI
jgi:hypothetical protein